MPDIRRAVAGRLARGVREVASRRWQSGRGNGVWVGAVILWSGLKLIRRLGARKREVVYRAELRPGEGLRIRHLTSTVGEAAGGSGDGSGDGHAGGPDADAPARVEASPHTGAG
ncbi:MAG TPA: hypothetical protein DEP66_07000 [Acidimicrobiaceae bacterium]|nr:hypothetical protein [Acidimicrobiaceae bacterium]HCB37927.1 hypothetical protein [Acidimicrobiaceae bacterium]